MDKSKSVRVHAITHPLRVGGIDRVAPEGVTIARLMADLEPDPLFADLLEVWVDGEPVERARWEAYRPAAGSLVTVTAFPAPGKGGKDILRAVLTIAVIAISVWAGPGAAGLMGLADSAFAAGMATAGISAAGMLAVNALVPPAKIEAGSTPSRAPTHYIEGARNTLRPYEPVPVHYGRSRYTPPLGARTYTESLGDKQYLRMLVVWGLGPLSVTDMRIGATPLSDFTNIQIEHRPGLPSDPPLTLFPSSVIQEELSILLSQASGWVTRSAADGAVELSIDLAAPALVMYDSDGDPHEMAVALEVQYCEHGTGAWRHPARADVTTSFEEPVVTVIPIYDPVTASYTGTTTYTRYPGDTWVEGGAEVRTVTIRHNRPEALRHGLSWRVPAGRYDVRVRRLTEDTDSDQTFDDIYWAALRTYRADPPVTPPVPLCMTALRIQATDQLDRMVDDLNGIVQSIAPRWDGSAWAARATSCPAALIRRALQGPGVPAPVADEWINLESLQAFAEHCAEHGYEYNEVIQADTSVWDLCSRIAAAGRATFGLVDWGWGVIIDRPRGDLEITTHVTPRNSRDFRIEKAFTDLPHAWRVAFANEEQDWRPDEMIVYRDGYGPGTASRFEQLSLPGVTSPDQVYALARYHMAVAVQRPERWVCRQDFEHLVLKRGDRALRLTWPWNGKVITDSINNVPAGESTDTLKALSMITISGHIEDISGNPAEDFTGIVTHTVFGKPSVYKTLANDGGEKLEFTERNAILFAGKTKALKGRFRFSFIVPRDIDYSPGQAKIIYYASDGNRYMNGSFTGIVTGGFSNSDHNDSSGPFIRLFLNDTLFRSGGIAGSNPVLLALIEDEGGINTAGTGIGHDITFWLDGDNSSPVILNNHFKNDFGSYSSGSVYYPLHGLSPGSHTLTLKAWDNFNNSSEVSINFVAGDEENIVLKNLLNYPNPFSENTRISLQHNRPEGILDVAVSIFNINGQLIRVLHSTLTSTGYQLEPIFWDGRNSYGQKAAKGIYPYSVKITSETGETSTLSGRMIIY